MPTFCRHNRFLERCPICSKTLPGHSPSTAAKPRAKGSARAGASTADGQRRRVRAESVRVRREGRAEDDGYRSTLVPGLRASADANRLAEEIAFSSGRLHVLASEPPGLYGEARVLAGEDRERATWTCLLIAYLGPLEGDDPFAGVRLSLEGEERELPNLDGVPLGPRTSHDPARGAETLRAYWQWVQRSGRQDVAAQSATAAGSQAVAFTGDPAWSEQRRFERIFERLALPGFVRMARYDLLVTLGALGLYELRPDSLHLAGARGFSAEDVTTLAAKRLFGIGDPLLLERRAASLAQAVSVPVEALDLALANWQAPQRATMGCPPEASDNDALERANDALGL
jgi:Alpha-glutamyl/putrescinyl thymine pyrophosphorylase clade 3